MLPRVFRLLLRLRAPAQPAPRLTTSTLARPARRHWPPTSPPPVTAPARWPPASRISGESWPKTEEAPPPRPHGHLLPRRRLLRDRSISHHQLMEQPIRR